MAWWIIIIFIIGALLFMKVYSKLTCGMCKCDTKMTGKLVIVTGANTGIGYQTAIDLARRGARVIMACRDEKKALAARRAIVEETGNEHVEYRHLDLASPESIRTFAANFREKRLDVLVNNAGAAALGSARTPEGILLEMQINHYGPFLLTTLLMPPLLAATPSRIVNVASFSHWLGSTDLASYNAPSRIVGLTYATSKLCNVLFTKELSRRLRGTGVVANTLHPGLVKTEIYRNTNFILHAFTDWYNEWLFKTEWQGAQTTIHLAVSPECGNITGQYFTDCKPGWVSWKAYNAPLAKDVWEASAKIVGLDENISYSVEKY